ncbi:unnamed protein product [Rotaria socialis]|uniref:Uncharacterized protein n=2 Tax=Rotaria socialis TaxID=392032 RepID=A0A817XGT7_9BILA|nr:unnamed protein product [Rotaria socialis]
MATVDDSSVCSVCNKLPGKRFCMGCKKYFCSKDFKEHEKQLSIQFDNEIVRSHDELLDMIQKLEKPDDLSSDVFDQIDQWKKLTINKVKQAAERARHELIELLDKRRTAVTKQLEAITKEIRSHREEENFLEDDIARLRTKLNEIQKVLEQFTRKDTKKAIIATNDQIDWDRIIYIAKGEEIESLSLNTNTKWMQTGVTIAGGNGAGGGMNQLQNPVGLCVDDDRTVYIADYSNHRIMEWKYGVTTGRVVAGGNGGGSRLDQLNSPAAVIIDKERNNLIISDYNNKRIVRWPRQNGTQGETIISNVGCWGLALDDVGFIYIADYDKHEVRRYQMGENQGTIVAGGNGVGSGLNQLNHPTCVFVDRDHSVYVSDSNNHRIMKWIVGAKQGIIVAGGQGSGNSLTQLSSPYGVFVDHSSTIYVADGSNHRIVRWYRGATQGEVIVGGHGPGNQSNQLNTPFGLSFDREGNIYVSEHSNHRVQKFNVQKS